MVKHGIQIYARLKPTKRKTGLFESSEDADGNNKLSFIVPKKESEGYVNNKKESYNFKFDRIFQPDASQNEVFEHVAKAVIDNVIAGYNGTIFAYGQTGSGKTFTITGGAERYDDRGLIPRSLSYIFKYQKENPDKVYTTQVTYMEIYNEQGHDLLDQQHQGAKLEDFPKVHLMEGADGDINLKNLSVHESSNEESALNLLFLGDTNRMIAETPMNMASTRSHCIFSIHMTSREPGSAVIRRSKLHLVDLAGSERIGKTGVGGTLLSEAKYINLSLHFLEQVITALTEKGRSHIPYRNSMLTSVLRDSLGGNCMTTMVATCSVEKGNVDESISTCRFAQRVALIKNDALLNEELSPKLMISRLQQQVKDLRDELQLATGEARTEELTEEEKVKCVGLVKTYVEQDGALSVGADMRKIHLCFRLLKDLVVESRQELADKARQAAAASRQEQRSSVSESARSPAPDFSRVHMPTEVSRLQELLEQRDNEINILVNMLKREKRRAAEAMVKSGTVKLSAEEAAAVASVTSPGSVAAMPNIDPMTSPPMSGARQGSPPGSPHQSMSHSTARHNAIQELSVGQREAYELFRRDYRHTAAMEESKAVLKERYAMAKQLGEDVHQSRLDLNAAKKDLEKYRVTAAVRGVADGETGIADEIDAEEQAIRHRLQRAKSRFKTCLTELKDMKAEIDHRKHLLETSRIQMLKDFQAWWMKQEQHQQHQQHQQHHQHQQQHRHERQDSATPQARQSPVSSSPRRSGTQTPASRLPSRDTTPRYASAESHGWASRGDSRHQDLGTAVPIPPSSASSQSDYQPGRAQSHTSLDSSNHQPASHRRHGDHGGSSSISLAANFSRPVDDATSRSQRASDSSGGRTTSHRSSSMSSSSSSHRTTSSHTPAAATHSRDSNRASSRRHANTAGDADDSSSRASSSISLSGRVPQVRPHHNHQLQQTQPELQQQRHHQYDATRNTSASNSTATASNGHLGSGLEAPRQITLTGDSRADADILAFMKARQSLLEKGNR